MKHLVQKSQHETPIELRFDNSTQTHPNLRGKTFAEVYRKEKGFVEFSKGWVECTGIYKKWQEYIKLRE